MVKFFALIRLPTVKKFNETTVWPCIYIKITNQESFNVLNKVIPSAA